MATEHYGLGEPRMLEQTEKLFAYGKGRLVDLPRIVVVGDQSSGKSSVLEGLTKKPLPGDSGLDARFATQIISRRTNIQKRTSRSFHLEMRSHCRATAASARVSRHRSSPAAHPRLKVDIWIIQTQDAKPNHTTRAKNLDKGGVILDSKAFTQEMDEGHRVMETKARVAQQNRNEGHESTGSTIGISNGEDDCHTRLPKSPSSSPC